MLSHAGPSPFIGISCTERYKPIRTGCARNARHSEVFQRTRRTEPHSHAADGERNGHADERVRQYAQLASDVDSSKRVGTSRYVRSVTGPSNALDPQVMLATSIHAQPGVYALLLGSGVSTGAGIPTGWGVITELVRRAATAQAPEDESAGYRAATDPEAWWAEHGDGQDLGYSNLLASLGATPGARQALLRGFFEPSEDDLEQGLKTPSAAHRAIADMVKRGVIKVILTTNFDRLMERALEDIGVSPQVIAAPENVAGMTPLPHASATVVKLHGDYADLQMRNTVDELETYPEAWNALLDRVFDEYGLLVAGWSADWDHALVAAMRRAPSRRYPLYWDARSGKGETATTLLALHRGVVIPASSADDLFAGLDERLTALDRLSEPPLTTAIAIQRLKRYMPDPVRRIDLYDLVIDRVTPIARSAGSQPVIPQQSMEPVQEIVDSHLTAASPLIELLAVGGQHDSDGAFTSLWVECIQRLLDSRGQIDGVFNGSMDSLRHLPALLVMRGLGLVALRAERHELLLALLTQPTWRSRFGTQEREPAHEVLDEYSVTGNLADNLPMWDGQKWRYPPSHFLRHVLREPLRDHFDDDSYRATSDLYEFCIGLLAQCTKKGRVVPGEFIGDSGWDWNAEEPYAARTFRDLATRAPETWAWWPLLGTPEDMEQHITALSQTLKPLRHL